MLGSIDCTSLDWRMCPKALRGQYKRGDHKYPTVAVEAVASQDLWFWHAYCGPPGSLNDTNVLQTSPIFLTQRNGTTPKCPFQVSGHTYKHGYYLTDGIYPKWSTFVKTFPFPTDPDKKKFKKLQEGARNDVEDSRALIAEQRESVAKGMYYRDFKTYTRPHDHLEDKVKKIAITRKREITEKYNWLKNHLV
ncbi:uncharacterized protein LOC143563751 [Bidens hawaiensis]|uniref:uncharacterized protein LOC143563751 n=1 Tax=Bidens hawaiensis TaxID=980011 RepID=UPI00404B7308